MKLPASAILAFVAVVSLISCSACTSTRQESALPDQPATQQSWLSKTTDATVSTLKKPVDWILPPKSPPASTEPTYAPADAVIITRSQGPTPIFIPPPPQ